MLSGWRVPKGAGQVSRWEGEFDGRGRLDSLSGCIHVKELSEVQMGPWFLLTGLGVIRIVKKLINIFNIGDERGEAQNPEVEAMAWMSTYSVGPSVSDQEDE